MAVPEERLRQIEGWGEYEFDVNCHKVVDELIAEVRRLRKIEDAVRHLFGWPLMMDWAEAGGMNRLKNLYQTFTGVTDAYFDHPD